MEIEMEDGSEVPFLSKDRSKGNSKVRTAGIAIPFVVSSRLEDVIEENLSQLNHIVSQMEMFNPLLFTTVDFAIKRTQERTREVIHGRVVKPNSRRDLAGKIFGGVRLKAGEMAGEFGLIDMGPFSIYAREFLEFRKYPLIVSWQYNRPWLVKIEVQFPKVSKSMMDTRDYRYLGLPDGSLVVGYYVVPALCPYSETDESRIEEEHVAADGILDDSDLIKCPAMEHYWRLLCEEDGENISPRDLAEREKAASKERSDAIAREADYRRWLLRWSLENNEVNRRVYDGNGF